LDIQSALMCSDGIPAPVREPSPHFNIVAESPLSSDNLMPCRMITRSQTQSLKLKTPYVGIARYPLPHCFLTNHVFSDTEPSCFSEATKHCHWRDAMDIEFNTLITNGTWDLVPPTQGTSIVGSKWVFRVKCNADDSIEHFKARLVTKGYHQQPGLDFTETFSPVVKANTIHLVLSLAITRQWTIHQIDIQNAFLHGQLQEELCMQQPQSYVHLDFPHHVCRLRKSLYGFKQAP